MKYTLLPILFIMLVSCQETEMYPNGAGRTSYCYAFDDVEIKLWVPYDQNITRTYVNSNGDAKKLTIDSTYGNEAYSTYEGGCYINGAAYALVDTLDTVGIDMSVYYGLHAGDPLSPHLDIKWMSAEVLFKKYRPESDTLIVENIGAVDLSIKNTMTFGSITYNTVHEITFKKFPQFNPNELQKLYLVKGEGVVAYTTRDSTTYWLKK